MSGATSDDIDRPQSFTYRVTRFLSTASQAALNASAVISNQICHNINPTRSLSLSAISRSHNNSLKSTGNQQPRPPVRNLFTCATEDPVDAQIDTQFNDFLLCQGPRALEIGTEEEYRKHYAEEMSWRRDMGVGVHGEALPEGLSPEPIPAVARSQGVFERSVERRVGSSEFGRDWIRICNKHGSRAVDYPVSDSRCRIPMCPCDRLEDEQKSCASLNGFGSTHTLFEQGDGTYYLPIPGPPKANDIVYPEIQQPLKPALALSILLNESQDYTSTSVSPLQRQFTPPALSASSIYLGTPFSYADPLSSFISPSPEPPCALPVQKGEAKTKYLALYPNDHKLGFDCVCETCLLKAIKKREPDSVPTLMERRLAKLGTFKAKTPLTSQTLEESNYTLSGSPAPRPPCEPVDYFMSGNTMVPMYNYKEQLRSVAPSTWMLGDTIVYSVKSRDRGQASRKRGRNMGSSLTEDENTPEEEHGEGKRRRRK
ncbi:hypothetical protein EV426DRAFT_131638 [Tirmania nivea]|nr:hypothetical protein EV426DRAFT_131638 [Tirmania nivea]